MAVESGYFCVLLLGEVVHLDNAKRRRMLQSVIVAVFHRILFARFEYLRFFALICACLLLVGRGLDDLGGPRLAVTVSVHGGPPFVIIFQVQLAN